MNLIEKGCRAKLRFKTRKGNMMIEDLFDLSLQSLDRVGTTVLQDIKAQTESLLTAKKDESNDELKLEIVKYIIAEKQTKGMPIKNNNLESEEIL